LTVCRLSVQRSPADLAHVLRPLRETFQDKEFPNLLVGLDSPDDAAVYQISPDLAVILTTDFFTPVVDDPYTYGAVAAANAMSDVYAMGGQVVLRSIAAFPRGCLRRPSARSCGAAEKVAEAGR
jgi:selenide,water dikinase